MTGDGLLQRSYLTSFVDLPTTIYVQHYILIPEVYRLLSFSIFILYFELRYYSYTYLTYIFLITTYITLSRLYAPD
jgi:hypothetical protein